MTQRYVCSLPNDKAPSSERRITTRRLEAHYLAGGDVPRVIRAIIAAHRAAA